MSGKRSKQIRRAVARTMQAGYADMWREMLTIPWRGRAKLAWRLIAARNIDGTKRKDVA